MKKEIKNTTTDLKSILNCEINYDLLAEAIKTGFEWSNVESLWECLESEIDEFKNAVETRDSDSMEDELGDILFSIVNVARWHGINPELALLKANKKFKKRFQTMENIATKQLENYNVDEFEELWQTAKKHVYKTENGLS